MAARCDCPICFESLVSSAVTFPDCMHNVCRTCADAILASGDASLCPLCRAPVTRYAVNHQLRNLLDDLTSTKNGAPSERITASAPQEREEVTLALQRRVCSLENKLENARKTNASLKRSSPTIRQTKGNKQRRRNTGGLAFPFRRGGCGADPCDNARWGPARNNWENEEALRTPFSHPCRGDDVCGGCDDNVWPGLAQTYSEAKGRWNGPFSQGLTTGGSVSLHNTGPAAMDANDLVQLFAYANAQSRT